MAHQSTERACDRCRERRVKCDKTQPTCLRCEKLGKPCPGYDKKRKFVDEGISLRKKYHAGPEGSNGEGPTANFIFDPQGLSDPDANLNGSRLPSHDAVGELPSVLTGSRPNQALSDPTTLFGSHNGTPNLEPSLPRGISTPTPTSYSTSNTVAGRTSFSDALASLPGLQPEIINDDLWNETDFDPAWFNLQPDEYYGSGNNSCGFIPAAHIVDEVDRGDLKPTTMDLDSLSTSGVESFPAASMSDTFAGENSWARQSQLQTSAIITDEREHEMAYLIRHFTESIGPWMDLFDNEQHFGHLVPLKALRDALLRNAIAAVAAKQLGRVKGNKPFIGNQCHKPATMEVIADDGMGIDWFYKAANYYDKAIAFSRAYLQTLSGLGTPVELGMQTSISSANSDDLLVAVSIFLLYESLDNLEIGWLSHLTGLKSLLSVFAPGQQISLGVLPTSTAGQRASFWNFARADYQAAYANRSLTLLDTGDLALWRMCGLQVQDDGSLYRNPVEVREDPNHSRLVTQTVSHTLLWLVLQVVNYISVDELKRSSDIRQSNWDRLTALLDSWYGNLPRTFQPCASMRYPLKASTTNTTADCTGNSNHLSPLTEVFFSIDQCAAALQLYHFGRILLLLNKPQTASPTGGPGMSRLRAYREISTEAIKHAREIVGIALGRPRPAVRVEMLLPLYVAGGCLEADEERIIVLEMLRAIEVDTGCSTEMKVRSLVGEWGWDREPKGVD